MPQLIDTSGTDDRNPSGENLFRSEGDYWTIAFAGQVIRLRDSRGLRYLAELLWNPGARISSVALVESARRTSRDAISVSTDVADEDGNEQRERARLTVTKGLKVAVERIGAVHPRLAEHLQVTIRRGYACSYTPDPRAPITWER